MVFTKSQKAKLLVAHKKHQKNKIFHVSKLEDRCLTFLLIALVVGFAFMMVYSQRQSQENFQKSVYFQETNNLLYRVQQEQGVAMLVTFKNKAVSEKNPVTSLFPGIFESCTNQTRTKNLTYEVLRYAGRTEVLSKVWLLN